MNQSNPHSVKLLPCILLTLLGCASPPPIAPTPEQVRTRSQMRALEFETVLSSNLVLKRNEAVSQYLQGVADVMRRDRPWVGTLPVTILIHKGVAAPGIRAPWRSYGVLGTRIYLSAPLLKLLEFENEVAAIIAWELSLIDSGAAVARAEARSGDVSSFDVQAVLGVGGIFDFTSADLMSAIEGALEMLYRTGYDPRGLTSVLSRFNDSPKDSPYPPEVVAELLPAARRAIALRTPLRNPIVRSEKFLEIRKRMQRL